MARIDRRDFLKGTAALGARPCWRAAVRPPASRPTPAVGSASPPRRDLLRRHLERAEQAGHLGVARLRSGRHQGADLRPAGGQELRQRVRRRRPQVRRLRQRRQVPERDEGGAEVRPAPPLRRLRPRLRRRRRRRAVRHQPADQLPEPVPRDDRTRDINGQQYWIPWDWGFSSILYRTDKVDPADAAEGWNLFWNEKYSGKICMWDGGSTPVIIAGLVMDPPAKDIDNMTPDELTGRRSS